MGAAGLLVAAMAAQVAAAAPLSAALPSDMLRLDGDRLTFPSSTLDGQVAFTTDRVTLAADVLFAFDTARLGPEARAAVRLTADAVRERRPPVARIIGFTDARGSEAWNLALSRRRATAVLRALDAQLGPIATVLRSEGRGESDPVAANSVDGSDDPRGRALNRRVEVLLR